MRVIGGKTVPNTNGMIGAFVAKILPGGVVDTLGEVNEGNQVLEWNGVPLTGKTHDEVQAVIKSTLPLDEVEVIIRADSLGNLANEELIFPSNQINSTATSTANYMQQQQQQQQKQQQQQQMQQMNNHNQQTQQMHSMQPSQLQQEEEYFDELFDEGTAVTVPTSMVDHNDRNNLHQVR